nr:MAG TPA_asm: hypothetical protein [Caudoviricetes sp.]
MRKADNRKPTLLLISGQPSPQTVNRHIRGNY